MNDSMSLPIAVEARGGVTVIRLERPETQNALSADMLLALSDALVVGERDGRVGSHVDVGPTIAHVLGVEPLPQWQGASLFSPDHPGRAYAVIDVAAYQFAVVDARHKYILNATAGAERLFDLRADPLERGDARAEQGGVLDELRGRVRAFVKAEEAYLDAVADALRVEYLAIIDAGFTLQVDDPFLSEVFSYSTAPMADRVAEAERKVAAINRALRGIPRDRVRLHTCYGINEGPRVFDAPLGDLIGTLLTVNAGALSFEAGNPRHEYNYHVFESVKLPDDFVLLPGVISHATNIVEHPDTIADRIVRFAERVGRENVVASADCGFSSQATYHPEIHPKIIWAKFEALAEGARRATARLW